MPMRHPASAGLSHAKWSIRCSPGKGIVLVWLSLLILLAGCRLGPEPDTTITLSWWVPFAPESAAYLALDQVAQAYAAQYTDLQIELLSVPWDDLAPRSVGGSRLKLAQEEGEGPDLWGPVPHTWTGSFALAEQAHALDASEITNPRQYLDVALQACRFQGQQMGLPVLMETIALYYNRDLVAEPPTSFEDLVKLAQQLTDTGADRWGLALPLLSEYHIYPFIDSYGGYLYACDSESCNPNDIGLNNPGAVRGTQYLSDLYLKKKLFAEPLSDREVMYDYALDLFTTGKAAMLIDGPWALPEIRDAEINYGVALIPPLPGAEQPPRPLVTVHALYVSSQTAHLEQALGLLNYAAGPEGALIMQAALEMAPVRLDVLHSSALRQRREVRVWYDQAVQGVPLPNIPELAYIWSPWGQALDEAIPGLTPTQEVLDRAVEQIKGALQPTPSPD